MTFEFLPLFNFTKISLRGSGKLSNATNPINPPFFDVEAFEKRFASLLNSFPFLRSLIILSPSFIVFSLPLTENGITISEIFNWVGIEMEADGLKIEKSKS